VSVLDRLASDVRSRGGLLANELSPASVDGRLGALAASGRRAAGNEDGYALLVEEILEGYLLHYAAGRVVTPTDPDLSLLAGDRLFALGLARLAELGDLEAVIELAHSPTLQRFLFDIESDAGQVKRELEAARLI